VLAACLHGSCSREMLVIDLDRRPETMEFARPRIELPGDSIQFLLGAVTFASPSSRHSERVAELNQAGWSTRAAQLLSAIT
jgi:hypothetical protein